jgi:hypothetical protein
MASQAVSRGGAIVTMRKALEYGGIAAGVVLIALGIATIVLSVKGHNEVRSSLKQEQIVGSPDMTPEAIAQEAQDAGLPASTDLPTCNVADKSIDTGSEAKCFADYMRIHALESTGGLTYAQPVSNGARNIWVTETSLATALYTSFLAEGTALFGIVVAIALLLAGIGFMVLAIGGALRRGEREKEAQPAG